MIDVHNGLTLKLNTTNTNVATLSNQRLFVLRKKHITFINEHKRQNIKKIVTADIECCNVKVSSIDCKFVIAEHITKNEGYIRQGNFKYYFSLDCIKRYASDLLEIETENNFKCNEKIIFINGDELYLK